MVALSANTLFIRGNLSSVYHMARLVISRICFLFMLVNIPSIWLIKICIRKSNVSYQTGFPLEIMACVQLEVQFLFALKTFFWWNFNNFHCQTHPRPMTFRSVGWCMSDTVWPRTNSGIIQWKTVSNWSNGVDIVYKSLSLWFWPWKCCVVNKMLPYWYFLTIQCKSVFRP